MRPTLATIHIDALRHNFDVARHLAGPASVMAMLKANAYGHDLLTCASALIEADGFGVVELEAALDLRHAGWKKKILLLEGFYEPDEIRVFQDYNLTPTIHNVEQIDMLRAFETKRRFDIFLKINSGMNRLGFDIDAVPRVVERLRSMHCIGRISFMTHFACADGELGVEFQTKRLTRLAIKPDAWSMANSAALIAHNHVRGDVVRPGIMLYGASPLEGRSARSLGLEPVMTLQSRIIAVQSLQQGETVGYGATYTCPSPMRVGVVACGYGDGYPRHAGSGAPVGVGDRIARTIGRISMDKLAIDITDFPEAGVGTCVELWGKTVPVDSVATHAGTSGYELVSAVTPRVPRIASEAGQRALRRPLIDVDCH
ncbi:alanine racemase [Paraburkholderia kururiensis]|uniref:alanine racemase n=1 Tax=Paraburkholderia kururiensis TaxID=984307 RepID=UPI000F86226F|nr:alanine racemase [Paraburkholderia kururiensis]